MKTVNWKLKIFLLAVLFSIFSVLPANAQQAIAPTLSISPGLVRQTIKPGEKNAVIITVSNLGQDPIPLSVTKLSISGINNLGTPEFTAEARPHSGLDWLTVDKPDLILDAHASQEIQVTVLAPKDTVPGGYSAALIFQARLPSTYFDLDANTRIIPALSTSFLLSVDSDTKPTIENLSISSFQTPKVVVSTPVPFLAELSNPTGYFFFADGELTLTPTWGSERVVTQLASSVLMPESSRQYISAYTGTIWPGIYDAKFTLKQDGKVLIASSRFVSVPWPFIILVFVLAGLTAGFVISYKRRRGTRLRSLSG